MYASITHFLGLILELSFWQALAARLSKVESGLSDLSTSTQQIIGGISQLMSGFALRGSSVNSSR